MNKKGNLIMGIMFGAVALILLFSIFSLIEPFKENLDIARGSSSTLNCPGTPTFDQTDYNNDTTSQKLIRRPVCFVTGISMVFFVGVYLVTLITWVYTKWIGKI